MKRVLLTLLLISCCLIINAQMIDNRIRISMGLKTGNFFGKETINDNNYISPSLYSGYNDLKGWSVKGMFKVGSMLGIGAGLDYLYASDWESEHYEDYEGSRVRHCTISPVFQIHNRLSETGVLNRLSFTFEIAPGMGLSKLELENSLFDVQPEIPYLSLPLNSDDIFFGIRGSAGAGLMITNLFGSYINYSISNNWITSKLYNDKHFTTSYLDFGIFIKIMNDKHFMY